ncbi:MAG: thiamine pyrophosphate-binding protein [Phycisphaerae bacterium]
MKACDFIVRYLAETAGIRHVFTFAGGTSAMMLDSIVRQGLMTVVPTRHEENAAFAADGYARVKRGLGLALAMSGPGATNMITGIAQSFFDSSPVLYLTGNVTTTTYKYGRPVRQMGYQEADIVSIVQPITKAAYFVDRVEMVPAVLRSALREALEPRRGPTLYDVPFDVQKLEVDESLLKVPFTFAARPRLAAEDYGRFIDALAAAARPVLLLGGGIQAAGVAQQAAQFARKLNLPVVVSLLGKDAFPNDDPQYVGFIGSYGNRLANRTLAAADVVVALGTRIDSRQTGNVKLFQENKTIVHVDVDPGVIGSTVRTAVGINLDLRTFFCDFFAMAEESGVDWQAPKGWWRGIRRVAELLPDEEAGDCGPLNPKTFLRKLSEAQRPGTIYTGDVGNNQMWSARRCRMKEGDRILYSGGLGTMGYAVPAAVGAHFASPASPVVAILGDGGFQMSLPELSTISEFQVPAKLVVINNGVLGLMKNFQDENFGGVHPATVDGYRVPDVCRVAGAYDIPNRSVDRDADVDAAVAWLGEQTGPALLEARVSPEWGPQPKIMPGRSLAEQRPQLPPELERQVSEALK